MHRQKSIVPSFFDRETVFVFFYMAAMAVVPGISYVAALHLILLALIKRGPWYFKSLVYFSLLKHFNPLFHPPSTNLFLLFVLMLFVVFIVQGLFSSRFRFSSLEKKFYTLLLIFALTSMVGSLYPTLSLIRIAIVWVFIFVVFQSIRRLGNFNMVHFLLQITSIIIWASAPLMLTGAGYMQGVGFFKGVINHSQDFALILLPLFVFYAVVILSRTVKEHGYHFIVLSVGFVELVLSASRAAMGAVIVSLGLYALLSRKSKIKQQWLIIGLFSVAGVVFYVANNPEKVEQKLSSFFMKYQQSGYVENYTDSVAGRLYLLEVAKDNVRKYPLTGIGFNVQTYYQDPLVRLHLSKLIKYIPGTHIMYSRPLEKGNLYAAVFEENGLIAGGYFLYILLWLLWFLYRSSLSYTWVPLVAMMFNFMGEASLFSPSGPGNFQILLISIFFWMAFNERRKAYKNV